MCRLENREEDICIIEHAKKKEGRERLVKCAEKLMVVGQRRDSNKKNKRLGKYIKGFDKESGIVTELSS